MRADRVLELGGGDVLAARGDDQFLLAAGDEEEAILEVSDVARVEPSVANRISGGVGVVPVLGEDHRTLDENFAILVGNRDGHPGDRPSDRTHAPVFFAVRGDRRCGFRQPIALVDRHACATEEVPEARPERCSAGDRAVAVAAQCGTQLLVDQGVEHRVLELQRDAGPALFQRLAVLDGGVGGLVEDRSLAAVVCLLLGRVVDLLEHARDRQHVVRLEGGEMFDEVRDIARVPHDDATLQARDGDDASEDVCQWEEEQRRIALFETRSDSRAGCGALGEEVRVGEDHALGAPGGARGVDQRRCVGRHRIGVSRVEFCVGYIFAAVGQLVHRAVVDDEGFAKRGQSVGHLAELVAVVGVLDDKRDGSGVLEEVLDLIGCRGLVDRDRCPARTPDGVVQERPLVPSGRTDRDAVARCDPGRDETFRDGVDLVGELLCGHRDPLAGRLSPEQWECRAFVAITEQSVDQRGLVFDGQIRRSGVLLHVGGPLGRVIRHFGHRHYGHSRGRAGCRSLM